MAMGRGWVVAAVSTALLVTSCTLQSDGGGAAPATTTTVTTTTRSPTTAATSPEVTSPARTLVDTLTVRQADDPPAPTYRRAAFGDDWEYDPATGCNTRERVLADESLITPTIDDRCRPTGRWRSAYDGLETDDPADLQIDHMVALADAWRSGAWLWDDARRFEFANDLTDPATLIAVSGTTNQSKGDSSPDQWLPPDPAARCTYVTDWVAVKARWELSVTPAEKSVLVQVLSGC